MRMRLAAIAVALCVTGPGLALAEAKRDVLASLAQGLQICYATLGKSADQKAALTAAGWSAYQKGLPGIVYNKDEHDQTIVTNGRGRRPFYCNVTARGLTDAQADALIAGLVKSSGAFAADPKRAGQWIGTANGRKAVLLRDRGRDDALVGLGER